MKHHNAAIEVYKKVLQINPNHKMAHFCLGVSYDSTSRISLAFKHYKILKTLDKELAEKLYNIIFLE
jgi:tetratricopeptide (TPR) repeat protein